MSDFEIKWGGHTVSDRKHKSELLSNIFRRVFLSMKISVICQKYPKIQILQ
jgi:hypothetical protein